MSKPENLEDLYADELKDLWSANDQMAKTLKSINGKASDKALKAMIATSIEGIKKHTALLKELLAGQDEKGEKEHCKGMEGLTKEAIKHTSEEAPEKDPIMDAVIITQVQRMTHYGIAGFGTVASFAETLGLKKDTSKLKAPVKNMYNSDKYMSQLAKTTVNIQADEN